MNPLVAQRVRHLRANLLACGLLLIGGAAVAGLVAGAAGATGASAGVALVTASYTASTLAIAWADQRDPRLVLPVGLGMYVTKFSLLGVVLVVVGGREWAGKIPMAVGIVAAVVTWTAAQIWWIVHHERPYHRR